MDYNKMDWIQMLDQEGFHIYGNYKEQANIQDLVLSLLDGFFRLENANEQIALFPRNISGGISPAAVKLTRVPDHAFENRNELERWINYEKQLVNKNLFLFEDIRQLMALDKKNLGMGNYEKF